MRTYFDSVGCVSNRCTNQLIRINRAVLDDWINRHHIFSLFSFNFQTRSFFWLGPRSQWEHTDWHQKKIVTRERAVENRWHDGALWLVPRRYTRHSQTHTQTHKFKWKCEPKDGKKDEDTEEKTNLLAFDFGTGGRNSSRRPICMQATCRLGDGEAAAILYGAASVRLLPPLTSTLTN